MKADQLLARRGLGDRDLLLGTAIEIVPVGFGHVCLPARFPADALRRPAAAQHKCPDSPAEVNCPAGEMFARSGACLVWRSEAAGRRSDWHGRGTALSPSGCTAS